MVFIASPPYLLNLKARKSDVWYQKLVVLIADRSLFQVVFTAKLQCTVQRKKTTQFITINLLLELMLILLLFITGYVYKLFYMMMNKPESLPVP